MAPARVLTGVAEPVAFIVRAVLWSLALFGFLRISFVEQAIVLALLRTQATIVQWYVAAAANTISITPSCAASDVMAMCLGVILAYPATWRRRLAGAAGGLGIIIGLNILRLATLAIVVSRWPESFTVVHVIVWPVLLIAATAAYVGRWMLASHRPSVLPSGGGASRPRVRRFAWIAGGLLALHLTVAPWTLTSRTLTSAGAWTARTAQRVLTTAGFDAQANGTRLTTTRGEFQITPECLLTPILPLYLAAIFSLPLGRTRRLVALAAAVPIFLALGVMRVLVLAVPAALIGSPLFVVHGFFQIVTALAIVAVACRRTSSERPAGTVAWNRYVGALGLGAIAIGLGASTITSLILWVAGAIRPWFPSALTQLAIPGDLQGVLVLAPAYQVGLLAALWFAWRPMARLGRVTLALAALVLAFVACLAATGAWLAHFGTVPHALVLRAWSLLAPLGIAWLFLRVPANQHADAATYRRFWGEVGDGFPDLGGAASTHLYTENERDLLLQHLPTRPGARLLKTDLWDEAKNTRILRWAASRGIDVYGLDLSMPTVRQAKREFTGVRSPFVVADVRHVPFASGSFDAIYSMGTIEHFDETEAAVVELARLLAPGGRLILGVPNRHNPFLRPLMVALLHARGWVPLRIREVVLAQTTPADARSGRPDSHY